MGFRRLRRKHALWSFYLASSFFLCFNAYAADQPFKAGETIYYYIQKMGIKAGSATLVFKGMHPIGRKPALLIYFTSRGFNFYDQERIYLDPKDFYPLRVERDINIFGSKEKITEEYLDNRIQITKTNARGKKSQQTLENKSGIDNIYGFIYRYRLRGSFKENDVLDLHLPTKDVTIKLVRREQVSAAKRNFDSYYMESTPAQYKLWFDTGVRKLPLRISGASAFGDTVMVMKDYRE